MLQSINTTVLKHLLCTKATARPSRACTEGIPSMASSGADTAAGKTVSDLHDSRECYSPISLCIEDSDEIRAGWVDPGDSLEKIGYRLTGP